MLTCAHELNLSSLYVSDDSTAKISTKKHFAIHIERESFKSDQLRLIRTGEGPGSWRERNDPENRASSLARLSPRLPRQREFMRHLFVVDSLDKRIQKEKELIHLASAGGGTVGGYFVFVWRVLT